MGYFESFAVDFWGIFWNNFKDFGGVGGGVGVRGICLHPADENVCTRFEEEIAKVYHALRPEPRRNFLHYGNVAGLLDIYIYICIVAGIF